MKDRHDAPLCVWNAKRRVVDAHVRVVRDQASSETAAVRTAAIWSSVKLKRDLDSASAALNAG